MAFRLKYFNFFLTRFIIFLYGSYVRSVTGDIDLKTIYLDQINQNLEKKKFKSEREKYDIKGILKFFKPFISYLGIGSMVLYFLISYLFDYTRIIKVGSLLAIKCATA